MSDSNSKDTVYVDIDDEITAIIEKVRAADAKIVALVLPKRATVFQSIVNMKLLKRSADNVGKRVVLITSEAGLLPLAGTVGLHVAKTLQSRPEIPLATPEDSGEEQASEIDDSDDDFNTATAGNRSIGELAGAAAVGATAADSDKDDAIETLHIDNDEPATDDTQTGDGKKAAPAGESKPKKDKKLKIPNFNRFRKRTLLLIPLLLLIIIGIYVCLTVLPKANIVIKTDSSDLNSSFDFTADTGAQSLDKANKIVPAQVQQEQKTGSQQVVTTGKKNNGKTATGTVDMTVTKCGGNPFTMPNVPAGTGVSDGNLTFISQGNTQFQGNGTDANGCYVYKATSSTPVTALSPGTKYNLSAVNFTVSGVQSNDSSSSTISSISASATGTTTGGTDDIQQIVTQSDIDNATQKIQSDSADSVKQELEQKIRSGGMFPLVATFSAGKPNVTTSSKVGDEASTVTVTQTTTYTMFSVNQNDLKTLVEQDVKGQIDPSKQTVLSAGLDKAQFKLNDSSSKTAELTISTTATAGPDLNVAAIKKQIAGKRAGEVKQLLGNNPGVNSVDVHLSPFWVTKVPGQASKVTITFEKS